MRLPFRSIWSEFKTFAFKGNMIDLAVAVVIGTAFSGVINSLVKDIVMPAISYVDTAATVAKKVTVTTTEKLGGVVGLDGTQSGAAPPGATQPPPSTTAAPPAPALAAGPAPLAAVKAVDMSWRIGRFQIGNFVAELLNFTIVAFAVFLIIVKMLGTVVKKIGSTPGPSEPTTKECPECLSNIPLKATRCAFCTAKLPPVA